MKLVSIESPYAGDTERNITYAKRAMLDSIERDEAPFASHLLYPQVLDDNDMFQRETGFACSFAWIQWADYLAVYTDYGISPGMQRAIDYAYEIEVAVFYRTIGPNP